jgi:biopolymer transport protein ExbB
VKEGLTTYKALAHDKTLNKEQKLVALTKSIEEATTLEMPMLEKNMMILSTLGTVATLVALLGTVIGMIRSFQALGAGVVLQMLLHYLSVSLKRLLILH